MVGKLDLGQGENNGFYPRLAKANAEAEATPTIILEGPFNTSGVKYWLLAQNATPTEAMVSVGFDIDADPNPDVFVPLKTFIDNPDLDPKAQAAIRAKAQKLWGV